MLFIERMKIINYSLTDMNVLFLNFQVLSQDLIIEPTEMSKAQCLTVL